MPKDTIGELSQYVEGMPVDRVALAARRAQNTKPQGLIGYTGKPVATQPKPEAKPTGERWASVAARLWSKAIPAQVEVAPGVFSYATPGAGIIGYGDIPTSVTKKIGTDAPVLGWDPKTLDKEELFLLNQLVAMRQKEAKEAEKTYANDPRMQQAIAQNVEPDDE